MNNEKHKGNLKIALEYISDDDSIGEKEFKTTAKLISLMPNGISVEKVNQKNKNYNNLYKKNTRMSSNNEDIDSENDNEKKSINNNQLNDNDDNNDNLKSSINNNFNNSDNNLILVANKKKHLFQINSHDSNNSLNKFDKLNNSEINQINIFNDDNEKNSLYKKSSFSPIKKRRKIILEEKTKNRGFKRSIFHIENKEEKKEEVEEKKFRKDKNGTLICKKNKKKVKIGFLEPFTKIIPIESYKKYNVMTNIPKGERYISKDNCECCIIF